jgi:hypothetical protein
MLCLTHTRARLPCRRHAILRWWLLLPRCALHLCCNLRLLSLFLVQFFFFRLSLRLLLAKLLNELLAQFLLLLGTLLFLCLLQGLLLKELLLVLQRLLLMLLLLLLLLQLLDLPGLYSSIVVESCLLLLHPLGMHLALRHSIVPRAERCLPHRTALLMLLLLLLLLLQLLLLLLLLLLQPAKLQVRWGGRWPPAPHRPPIAWRWTDVLQPPPALKLGLGGRHSSVRAPGAKRARRARPSEAA